MRKQTHQFVISRYKYQLSNLIDIIYYDYDLLNPVSEVNFNILTALLIVMASRKKAMIT